MILQRTRIPRKRSKPRRKRPELFHEFREYVKVMPDGREICNLETKQGKDVYKSRILAMLRRQERKCCNCRLPLEWNESTFEHENGRGAGKQDDRIMANGNRINGASHKLCNQQRGSKRTPIWHGPTKENLHAS